jgi:hypothetical protein
MTLPASCPKATAVFGSFFAAFNSRDLASLEKVLAGDFYLVDDLSLAGARKFVGHGRGVVISYLRGRFEKGERFSDPNIRPGVNPDAAGVSFARLTDGAKLYTRGKAVRGLDAIADNDCTHLGQLIIGSQPRPFSD